jgi:aldehyde:ferredoxin oxidoreductase
MLDRYYALHGWDVETSWPTPETLEKLGLDECAAYIRGLRDSYGEEKRLGGGCD